MASNMPGTQLPTRNVSGKTGSETTPGTCNSARVGNLSGLNR